QTTGGWFVSVSLIEQPDDWVPPIGTTITVPNTSTPPPYPATATGVTNMIQGPNYGSGNGKFDISGGWGTNTANWPVQAGDYIEIRAAQTYVYKISSVYPTDTTRLDLSITPGPVTSPGPVSNWRVVRQPRQKTGDQVRAMPSGSVIDLNTNAT